MRSTTRGILGALLVLMLLAAACGNSETDDATDTTSAPDTDDDGDDGGDGGTDEFVPVDAPGVTDDTIRVAGVTSTTNPLGGNYGDAYDGVKAYFEMINSEGGIYGRQLELVAEHDDQVSNNQAEVQAILAQDDVFAVLPVATLLFTGAVDLVEANVPTFGWNIQVEWAEGDNLFGEKGSYICTDCTGPVWPWVAEQMGAENVGILAYGISAQSKDAAAGFRKSFELYENADIVFFDDSLQFGVPDLSGEVAEMKEKGVDLVLTAMDQNGVVTLQREMNKQGLDAIQYLSNAYDPEFIEEFGDLFEGSVVGIQFWPFEEETDEPEGMTNYRKWIEEVGGPMNEISMSGWLSADLFVTGLREAGPDFSRQKVIDGINSLTDWDADGLNAGFDWTLAHEDEQPDACFALLEVDPDGYEVAYGEPGEPFVCLDNKSEELPEAEFRS